MLNDAIDKRREWQMFFERAKRISNKQAMRDAARNSKALEGVIKTLRWTLGEQGIERCNLSTPSGYGPLGRFNRVVNG